MRPHRGGPARDGTMDADFPSPPLSLWDAEQIVRRLAPALREHGPRTH